MTDGDKKAADGPALWAHAREATTRSLLENAPGIDALDLAAYLEGRGDEAVRARVEAALAASPETLELAVAACEALDAGSTARAQDLVPDGPARWPGWMAWLGRLPALPQAPQRAVAFAAVAAGFIVVSVAGFELGRAEYAYSTQVDSLLAREVGSLLDGGGEDIL
jgi:anti-sigma factor RsiW